MNEKDKKNEFDFATYEAKIRKLEKRNKRLTYGIIIFGIGFIASFLVMQLSVFTLKHPNEAITNIKVVPPEGKCETTKPESGNYARVLFVLKVEKPIKPRYFIWAETNYARRCFQSQDSKTYTFNAYLPYIPGSTIPLYALIRTDKPRNQVEYCLKVFDLDDNLIGQFPADGTFIKSSIHGLNDKLEINENLTF